MQTVGIGNVSSLESQPISNKISTCLYGVQMNVLFEFVSRQ